MNTSEFKKFYADFHQNPMLIDQVWITSDLNIISKPFYKNCLPRCILSLYRYFHGINLSKSVQTLKNIHDFSNEDAKIKFIHAYVLVTFCALKKLRENHPQKQEILENLKTIVLPDVEISTEVVIDILRQHVENSKASQIDTLLFRSSRSEEPSMEEIDSTPTYADLKQSGIKYVVHQAGFKNMINILKMQLLVPGATRFLPGTQKGCGGNLQHKDKFLFASILPKLAPEDYQPLANDINKFKHHFNYRPDDEDTAILIFSKKVLANRGDYHFSLHWLYGKKEPNLSINANQIKRVKEIKGINLLRENEVVFSQPVDLKYLKEIWVLPSKRDEFIQLLKSHRIIFSNDPEYLKVKGLEIFPESLQKKP